MHTHTLADVLTIGRYINPSIGNIQLPSLSASRSSRKPIMSAVGESDIMRKRLPKETVSANKEERLTMGVSLYLL